MAKIKQHHDLPVPRSGHRWAVHEDLPDHPPVEMPATALALRIDWTAIGPIHPDDTPTVGATTRNEE